MHQRNHYAATAAGSATPDSQGPDSKTPGGSGQALQGSGNQVQRNSAIDGRTAAILRERAHERVLRAMAPITATSAEKREALLAIRDGMPGISGPAQSKRLLAGLEIYSISSWEAMRLLDIYHCPARILDLRKRGFEIATDWVRQCTEAGRPHRIGSYRLVRGQQGGVL